MSKTYRVPPAAPTNHGGTVAAWVMTVGVVTGAIVFALGLLLAHTPMMAIGAGLILVTIVVSLALRAAGLGQKRRGLVEK